MLIVVLLSLILGIFLGRLSKRTYQVDHIHRVEDPADWWKKDKHEAEDEED